MNFNRDFKQERMWENKHFSVEHELRGCLFQVPVALLIQSPDDSLGPSCVVLRRRLPQTAVQLLSWWEGLQYQLHLPSC